MSDVRGTSTPEQADSTLGEPTREAKSSTPSGGSKSDGRRPPVENVIQGSTHGTLPPKKSHKKIEVPYPKIPGIIPKSLVPGRDIPADPSQLQLSPYQKARAADKAIREHKPNPDKWRLDPQEVAFVQNYIGPAKFSSNQAAEMSGYNRSSGPRLLALVKIQKAIQGAMDRRAERLELTADNILRELMRIAFFDPAELFDEQGNLKSPKDIPEGARKALAGYEIKYGRNGTDKAVKFVDKIKALELLGKHLKLFKEDVHVHVTFEQLVLESMKDEEADPTPTVYLERAGGEE